MPDLAAVVPPSLARSCAEMTVGLGPGCVPASDLRRSEPFERMLSAFAASYPAEPDRAALVSLWSMYYLAALIPPAVAALLCRDRALPVGLDELGLAVCASGHVAFRLRHGGTRAGRGGRFRTLVEGHLAPFATLCAARAELAPRVIWHNAAVILDWTLGELRGVGTAAAARGEAEALLAGSAGACRLAHPLRTRADGTRVRRVCCLRYRLAGVADCAGLCPRADVASAGERR